MKRLSSDAQWRDPPATSTDSAGVQLGSKHSWLESAKILLGLWKLLILLQAPK